MQTERQNHDCFPAVFINHGKYHHGGIVMAKLKNEHYITIQEFMVNDLELSGNELIAYALIYGFSQDGESYFKGSLSYVAKWLNCSKATACNILNKLADDGFLEKKEKNINGVRLCDYTAYPIDEKALKDIKEKKKERKEKEKAERYAKKLNTQSKNRKGYSKNFNGRLKNLNGGIQKTLTHNTTDILDDTIDENIDDNTREDKTLSNDNGKVDTAFPKKSLPTRERKKTKSELKELEADMIKRFWNIGSQYDVSEIVLKNVFNTFKRYLERYTEKTGKVHPILKDETLERVFTALATISDTAYGHFENIAEYEPDSNGMSYLDEIVDEFFKIEHGGETDYHITHFANSEYLEKLANHVIDW